MNLAALSALAPRLLAMVVLLGLAGFFSGSETSLFSLTRGQKERLARSESSNDRFVTRLLANPRRLIVTILIGNELVNITFSSLSATVVERLAPRWGSTWVTLATTAVTVPLLLVFGEITPKSIAIRVAERWARFTARLLGLFELVALPIR